MSELEFVRRVNRDIAAFMHGYGFHGPGDPETWPPCTNHPNDPRTPEGEEEDEGPDDEGPSPDDDQDADPSDDNWPYCLCDGAPSLDEVAANVCHCCGKLLC